MKKLFLTTAMAMLTAGAFAQGSVNFANASTALGDVNRLNHWSDTAAPGIVLAPGWSASLPAGTVLGGLVASNAYPSLRAQLYYGAAGATSFGALTAVTAAPAGFRSTTSANVGSWNGGTRTVDSWSIGQSVTLGVLIWDSSLAADGKAALAALANGTYGTGGVFGMSSIFNYTVPQILDPPSAYLMANLQRFDVSFYSAVPEPSTFALAGLGAAALLIFRRRK